MNEMFIVLFLFYGKILVRQRGNVLLWYCEVKNSQKLYKFVEKCQPCKGAELEEEVC